MWVDLKVVTLLVLAVATDPPRYPGDPKSWVEAEVPARKSKEYKAFAELANWSVHVWVVSKDGKRLVVKSRDDVPDTPRGPDFAPNDKNQPLPFILGDGR